MPLPTIYDWLLAPDYTPGAPPSVTPDPTPGLPAISKVDVWAKDLIEISFAASIANNSDLSDIRNYKITQNGSSDIVAVVDVIVPDPERYYFANSIHLVVVPFVVGTQYTVTILRANLAGYGTETVGGDSNIRGVDGTRLNGTTNPGADKGQFLGRNTKIDSYINSRPSYYDVSPESIFRHIANAIFRSDDLIGGSRKDRLP